MAQAISASSGTCGRFPTELLRQGSATLRVGTAWTSTGTTYCHESAASGTASTRPQNDKGQDGARTIHSNRHKLVHRNSTKSTSYERLLELRAFAEVIERKRSLQSSRLTRRCQSTSKKRPLARPCLEAARALSASPWTPGCGRTKEALFCPGWKHNDDRRPMHHCAVLCITFAANAVVSTSANRP